MNCSKCAIASPSNVYMFPGTKWLCEKCVAPPATVQSEIAVHYRTGLPGRYLYVSELSNNLDKVQNYIIENIPLNNPYCSITLVEPPGLEQLTTAYDGVYFDRNCLSASQKSLIQLAPFAFVKEVDPITQMVVSIPINPTPAS